MNQEAERVGQNVPPPEPGVITSYGHGWRQLWKFILELFVIGLIAFFIKKEIRKGVRLIIICPPLHYID